MPFDQQEFELATRSLRELPRPSLPAMPEGHRRLLVLAEFLETRVAVKDFDLNCWSEAGVAAEVSCGTVACACGWASVIPQFREAGYGLEYTLVEGCMTAKSTQPAFGDLVGWSAVQAFFGVGDMTAERLFLPDYYDQETPTPTFVAEQSAIARTAEVGK